MSAATAAAVEAARAEVLRDPDDDDKRLAWARALGDDPRGRFITVQVQLARGLDPLTRKALLAEEALLLRAHAKTWGAPALAVCDEHDPWTFSRGGIDSVRIRKAKELVDGFARLMALEPVRRLELHVASVIPQLLARGWIGRLQALSVKDVLHGASLAELLASPQLAPLQSVNFGGCSLFDDDGVALVRSPHFRATALTLGQNSSIGDATAQALAQSARPLTRLFLPSTAVSDDGLEALLSAPWASSLQQLSLSGSQIGDAGGRLLLPPTTLPALRRLDVQGIAFSNDVRDALLGRWGPRVRIDMPGYRRRGRESLVELRGEDVVWVGTADSLVEFASAVAAARFGVDLFVMAGWANPEGKACARCHGEFLDGKGGECATCRGDGVTLGPPRPWSDFTGSALARFLERVRVDGEVLDAADCASAADELVEAAGHLDDEFTDAAEFVVAGLQQSWKAGRSLRRKRR